MAESAHGAKRWIIPDGYIPPNSSGALPSHESVCVLNTSRVAANIEMTAYFEDREPLEKMLWSVPPRRTMHIRTAALRDGRGAAIPVGVPYALEVVSDTPVFVQYSRLDSTQPENALMTTMGYPVDSGF
ncbi:MAG TPA: sensory rhodopsin transducer [Bacilli bacterium]